MLFAPTAPSAAPTATPAPTPAPDPTVADAVRAFARAGDARDVPTLEALLHPEFRVLVTTPAAPGARVLPRATYLQLARDGKVGGVPRAVEVRGVELRGDLAWADVGMESEKATFQAVMTFIRTDGHWLLAEDATAFRPKG